MQESTADCRYLGLLLGGGEDAVVGLGPSARDLRVGPGAKIPRSPAPEPPKRDGRSRFLNNWADPMDYLEESADGESFSGGSTARPLGH